MVNKDKCKISIYFVILILSLIWISIETFGAIRILTRLTVGLFWLFVIAICYVINRNRINVRKILLSVKGFFDSLSLYEKAMYIICIFVCVVMGFTAITTVPCNGDSLGYHLPRICYWIQNRSVDYYKCTDVRQNVSPVLTEYVMCHLYLLFNGDYFLSMVQWAAYCYSGYLVYSICIKLDIDRMVCIMGTILFYSMPIAVAECVTTQVDLVSVMITLMFIYLCVDLSKIDKLDVSTECICRVFLCAILVGLGYIAKTSICFLMIIFLIYLLICRLYKKDNIFELLLLAVISIFPIVFFIWPTMYRNYKWYGDIFASGYMNGIMVATLSPKFIILNVYKNLSLLMVFGENTRRALEAFAYAIAKILNVDINSWEITFTTYELNSSYHNDLASLPLVSILFIILSIIFFVRLIRKKNSQYTFFVIICMMAVLINLVILRFQAWGARLMLPAASIMCIVVAYIVNSVISNIELKNGIVLIAVGICIGTMIPAIDFQTQYSRVLISSRERLRGYFDIDDWKYNEYRGLFDYINENEYTEIGYIDRDFEYYLWAGIKNKSNTLNEVILDEVTDSLSPDCIIVIKREDINSSFVYNGVTYQQIWNDENEPERYRVFVPSESTKHY